MASTVPDVSFDAALAKIATANKVHVCTSEPANHAGIAAVTIGNYTLTAGSGNGSWLIANGDVSGRKLTMSAQSGSNGTGTGAANKVAFTDGTTLLLVIDGDGDTVTSGAAFTIAATNVLELRDPT